MSWVDTATAISALRSKIQDGPTDKLCSNKKLIGVQDGNNLIFKTFEFRRVTNFTNNALAFPFGVYKNGTALGAANISNDDPVSGTFQVTSAQAPDQRSTFTATYYYQWYLDTDLDKFLQEAGAWCTSSTNYIQNVTGLNPAIMSYAAGLCYGQAAMKFMTRVSEVYKLEDAPAKEVTSTVNAWRSLAKDFTDSAEKLRKGFYGRQDQGEQPLFGFGLGQVVDPQPRR